MAKPQANIDVDLNWNVRSSRMLTPEERIPEDQVAGFLKHCEDRQYDLASMKIMNLTYLLGTILDTLRSAEKTPNAEILTNTANTLIAAIEHVEPQTQLGLRECIQNVGIATP